MRKIKFWMLTAIFACGAAIAFTSCVANEDNVGSDATVEEIPQLEIAASEFNPTDLDVNVALLGSLSSSAEDEAVRYWFPKVTGQVTDETEVVITDEITAANKDAIIKVLNRFGMLLVVDPKEDNVRQYGEYFGVEPNVDYSKVELLGLTGFGDQFVSYASEDGSTSSETVAPSSIASKDIWDVAPDEYLRLKAFAQWVDKVEKKYTEFQKELEKNQKEIADAIAAYDAASDAGDAAAARRAMKRAEQAQSSKIDINTLRGSDLTAQLLENPEFESYDNSGRSNDKDHCKLSVTCNYSFKPLYEFPKGNSPGADYYIVETSVNWDCSETLKGFKQFDHGSGRDRRSYLFFPIECKFYSEPIPTKNNYQVQMLAGSGGDLKPDNVKRSKSVTNTRSFSIDGNISGGISGGKESGMAAGQPSSSSSLSGNLDASLGVGASWSKTESFTVEEYDVNKIVEGQKVGHTISVPGGEDGYRPRMVNKSLDKGFEISGGVNFRKTLHTNESWAWKVAGTSPDTDDSSIKVKFVATPRVSWSSYFYTYTEWGVREHEYTMSKELIVPAPNRKDVGFLNIKNTGDEDGKELAIFGVRAIDVTDPNNKVVVYENLNSVFVLFGNTLSFGLPANKIYDIELEMGRRSNKTKTYHLDRNWQVTSITTGKSNDLVTDMLFSLKAAQ
jgi:hypothetical protein